MRSIRHVPSWAYLLVLVVVFVNSVYLIYLFRLPRSGETSELTNGHHIINYIGPGTPVSKTAIRTGDTLISCNGYPLAQWFECYRGQLTGDTLLFGILRNNSEVRIPVILDSYLSGSKSYAWLLFAFSILFSTCSIYLLVRRPRDNEVKLFFIYIQLLVIVSSNPIFLPMPKLLPVLANTLFIFSGCFYGAILIHFHLVFPRRARIFERFRHLPALFYTYAFLFALYNLAVFLWWVFIPSKEADEFFMKHIRISLYSATSLFLAALAIAVYQYFTIKNTLARNQLILLITGSFFVFVPLALLAFFYEWFVGVPWSHTVEMSSAAGNLVLILCILTAIFRYRIWNVEVIVRKALLYLIATAIIILTYLLLIWLIDRLLDRQTNLLRFLILGVSVIFFLALRDRIQRLVDRIFHRETYDSATVVSEFEAKLTGIYRLDELKEKIFKAMDEIFHFRSFLFFLKKSGLTYETAWIYGIGENSVAREFEISQEMEERLNRSKVFSPEELHQKLPVLEITNGELIVPLMADGRPNGFFICGRKKSERIYSMQDIRVLLLLAQRVVALLHTANLYRKDLERQLMLERERARISQDMHDDVGASLTRISILSELAKNDAGVQGETKQWLGQISDTSRGVMEEMSQIIWALNPRNDTLEGLAAYIRRFASEFLEPTSIRCRIDFPEQLPPLELGVEIRRNLYLCVREALHNVVKHSGATQVRLALTLDRTGLSITVIDNGRGFDPAGIANPGNGLVSMKKRMNDIGGEFRISSRAGNGTEISFVAVPNSSG
jgi:signal transduction histidine kinase